MKKFLRDKYIKAAAFLFFLLMNNNFISAQSTAIDKKQDTTMDKKLYYRLTLGAGLGSGYPLQEDDFGIGGTVEFALQKQRNVYSLGIRGIQEFQIFDYSNVSNSVSSLDLCYGKSFGKRSFFASVSAGIGLVTFVQQGKLISTSGGWFSSYSNYEKNTAHTIGVPISVKLFWVPLSFTGVGLELFANINSKNTFYGINFSRQFGKLRPAIKNDKNLAAKILLLLLL